MNGRPDRRSQQTEQEELAGLLPPAAVPVFPRDRHLLLKEHLMDTVDQNTPRGTGRRNLPLRLALPVGLAAAAACLALAAGAGGTAPASPDGHRAGTPLGDVSDAGYTLGTDHDGTVRLTILEAYKPIDVPHLQRDLDRLGVRAHVYAGEPHCDAPAPVSPSYPADSAAQTATDQGRLDYYGWDVEAARSSDVLLIQPHRIPAGLQLYVYLPYAKTDPADSWRSLEAGLMNNPAPSCMPAQTYTNPLAGQFTPKPTATR
jgi:hypothetical protein